MIKKQIYIYFLFLACSLQLGHSLFPHTHAENHHHHHGEKHHHEEEHNDDNSLSHFFSHFNHHSDTFSNYPIEEVTKIIKKVSSEVLAFEIPSNCTTNFTLYHKKEVVRNKEPLIFISPHLHSLQFRGPPTLFS
ncbi:MAG TPA: hypothetical protein VJ780_10140 [Flavobacterium sp.]|nr:hypothetical protein [Flavobacterium sp.]